MLKEKFQILAVTHISKYKDGKMYDYMELKPNVKYLVEQKKLF